jgi:hypothetical protein
MLWWTKGRKRVLGIMAAILTAMGGREKDTEFVEPIGLQEDKPY